MTQIKSIEHLMSQCKDTQEDFFISFDFAKSSKSIEYITDQQEFYIINDIMNYPKKKNGWKIVYRKIHFLI